MKGKSSSSNENMQQRSSACTSAPESDEDTSHHLPPVHGYLSACALSQTPSCLSNSVSTSSMFTLFLLRRPVFTSVAVLSQHTLRKLRTRSTWAFAKHVHLSLVSEDLVTSSVAMCLNLLSATLSLSCLHLQCF